MKILSVGTKSFPAAGRARGRVDGRAAGRRAEGRTNRQTEEAFRNSMSVPKTKESYAIYLLLSLKGRENPTF
jgi:hypothetical protein